MLRWCRITVRERGNTLPLDGRRSDPQRTISHKSVPAVSPALRIRQLASRLGHLSIAEVADSQSAFRRHGQQNAADCTGSGCARD